MTAIAVWGIGIGPSSTPAAAFVKKQGRGAGRWTPKRSKVATPPRRRKQSGSAPRGLLGLPQLFDRQPAPGALIKPTAANKSVGSHVYIDELVVHQFQKAPQIQVSWRRIHGKGDRAPATLGQPLELLIANRNSFPWKLEIGN